MEKVVKQDDIYIYTLKYKKRMNKSSAKGNDNIEFQIYIGDYKIVLNMPKETRVNDVITMVGSYQSIHHHYGPENAFFIGLASIDGFEIVDYWMVQPTFNFVRFGSKLALKAVYSLDRKVETLTTNHFQFLKCLGEGAGGSVYLVRSRVTGYLFALKRIKKDSFQHYQDLISLTREQKILKSLPQNNHTVKFHASFESADHFNFLMQFYPGGQLFVHLTRQKLSQKDYKLYFCEVLAAIEFLHKNKILYRDLKPENILVDIKGHLYISDFGLSKCNFQEDDNANSHCGSADYMAPEIMENKEYNFCSDFYSIGAILHQFVTGLPPYYEEEADEKLHKIKKMGLKLDEHTKDPHLKALIKGLLHPNPEMRITDFKQIKSSPWLADVNWKKIEQKSTCFPFAPNVFRTYINQEFLNKQDYVDEINKYFESEKFESSGIFEYINPDSEKLLLGRKRTVSKEPTPMMKRKNNFTKEKSTRNLNSKSTLGNKGNLSIALYEKHTHREERGDTASTSNSNISCYEGKTTKNADMILKQNQNFKKEGSKRNLLKKVPSCNKIQTNVQSSMPSNVPSITTSHNVSQCSSRKIASSKEKAGLTLKTRNTEMMKSKSTLTPVHKSKSKEKSQMLGLNKTKEQPYASSKLKKEILPVSSYKIKLI